jgi:hypothetical protein
VGLEKLRHYLDGYLSDVLSAQGAEKERIAQDNPYIESIRVYEIRSM